MNKMYTAFIALWILVIWVGGVLMQSKSSTITKWPTAQFSTQALREWAWWMGKNEEWPIQDGWVYYACPGAEEYLAGKQLRYKYKPTWLVVQHYWNSSLDNHISLEDWEPRESRIFLLPQWYNGIPFPWIRAVFFPDNELWITVPTCRYEWAISYEPPYFAALVSKTFPNNMNCVEVNTSTQIGFNCTIVAVE
jgi:hypothetical protein